MRTIGVFVLGLLAGCATNPVTGRRQLLLLDRDTELRLGAQAYQEQLAREKRITEDPVYVAPVARVATRLAAEAERGWERIEAPHYQWEFQVIDDPGTANAWCLPGGKIAVFTGIFPICASESGLAVALGHEIMHAVLRHGNERLSQGMLIGLGTEVLSTGLGGEDATRKKTIQAALGLGASVGVLLPYSRANEIEADEYGLYLAARAGYDPQAGIEVWRRMEEAAKARVPEFLSTHPSHETRIENMQAWMPRAAGLYREAAGQADAPLPAPGKARPGYSGRVSGGMLAPRRVARGRIEDVPTAQFEFVTQRSIFVDRVRVRGPEAIDLPIEAKTGVPSGERRVVTVRRREGEDPALPPGRYTLAFEGRVDGRPWTETLTYVLE